jgi:hypothetical protein
VDVGMPGNPPGVLNGGCCGVFMFPPLTSCSASAHTLKYRPLQAHGGIEGWRIQLQVRTKGLLAKAGPAA